MAEDVDREDSMFDATERAYTRAKAAARILRTRLQQQPHPPHLIRNQLNHLVDALCPDNSVLNTAWATFVPARDRR